jgi:hypothetical protein
VSDERSEAHRRARMADIVRLIASRRERAPRSPRMERALKRLIWRYHRELQASSDPGNLTHQGSEREKDLELNRARKVDDA